MSYKSTDMNRADYPVEISIVVAVYNNANSIRGFFADLFNVMDALNVDYEILTVLDGPEDSSPLIVNEIARDKKSIRVVKLSRNFGQVSAILAGIENARGKCVVNISTDGQDPPELIREMYLKFKTGRDIVIAYRISREDKATVRLSSRIAYSILRSERKGIPKGGFDYFLLSSKAYLELIKLKGRFRFLQSDILELGFDPVFIPYHRKKSLEKSNYTFSKRLRYFEDGIVDSSYNPIRFFLYLGLTFAFSGFFLSLATLMSYFLGKFPFKGFSPLLISMLLLGGVILVCVAFIGMYVFRIYDIARGRPVYISHPEISSTE